MCAFEVHVCGEASCIDLVKDLAMITGDEVEVRKYKRLTPLKALKEAVGEFMWRNVTRSSRETTKYLRPYLYFSIVRLCKFEFVHCCVHCRGLQMFHVSLSFLLLSLSGRIV